MKVGQVSSTALLIARSLLVADATPAWRPLLVGDSAALTRRVLSFARRIAVGEHHPGAAAGALDPARGGALLDSGRLPLLADAEALVRLVRPRSARRRLPADRGRRRGARHPRATLPRRGGLFRAGPPRDAGDQARRVSRWPGVRAARFDRHLHRRPAARAAAVRSAPCRRFMSARGCSCICRWRWSRRCCASWPS